jgi:hypothetical protein
MAAMTTETAVGRLFGERPGRMRALMVSLIVGAGAGVMTYKLLRSEGDQER